MKKLLMCGLAAVCLYAQSDIPRETLLFRDGSGNVEYECTAAANNAPSVFGTTEALSSQTNSSIAIVTLTNISDSGSTATVTFSGAHGLSVGHLVTIAGGTVDTDVNGTYKVASVPGANQITFTSANVTDATYNEATLKLTTTAPRNNARVWSILKRIYTGSDLDREIWAYGSKSMDKACASRTSYF